MKIKQIVLFCLIFPSGVYASPSIDQELVALRLESMKTSMNARDFDLMTYRIRQIEVLARACELESRNARLPFSCLELRGTQARINSQTKSSIFRLTSLSHLEDQCLQALESKDVQSRLLEMTEHKPIDILTTECRSLLKKRLAIQTYKMSGRRIE